MSDSNADDEFLEVLEGLESMQKLAAVDGGETESAGLICSSASA